MAFFFCYLFAKDLLLFKGGGLVGAGVPVMCMSKGVRNI